MSDPDADAVLASFDHPEAANDSDAAAVLASFNAPKKDTKPSWQLSLPGRPAPIEPNVDPNMLTNAAKGAAGMVVHGVGTLADVATGTAPGAGSHAERWAAPFSVKDPTEQLDKSQLKGYQAISDAYDKIAGTGPAAAEIKTRIPQAMEAIGTAVPIIRGTGSLASLARGTSAEPPATAPPTPPAPLSASGAARSAPFEPADVPGKPGVPVDTEPVEGGVGSASKAPNAAVQERAAILSRVGVEDARHSALEGNAKDAATDWQLTKFDEPAGVAAKAQFDNERNAMQRHSEDLVQKTGGTLGTDEDSLNNRGQTIAKPFDALSDWFDARRKELYSATDAKAGGKPVTNLEGVDALLKDPEFRNTLLAKDQGGLLTSMENQLGEFRKGSPQGFNVQGAEQVRQWLNKIWTNDNKAVIGQVKGTLDNDVLKGSGEDVYGPARKLTQMQHQTLDNPSGINKLMEHDPQTPINRTTSYDKIPDTLTRLPPAQFDNVLKTLQTMPDEIQPQAQAAISEIKAHLLNKVHDAGTSTQGQWNTRGVEKVVKANSAKLQSAFADQPEVLQGVSDLRSAGKILSVNQGYPGAAAQASNALKRGLMSHAVSKLAATGGAAAGGAIAGPLGAAGGAAVGEALGGRAASNMAANAALKRWMDGVGKTSDLAK